MSRALELAHRGLHTTQPNPRVGCVIAQGETVVGEGWHQWAGERHAEVAALQQAGTLARGATAYVSLEPCSHHGRTPPCTEALIAAGIVRVVAAMEDPNPQVAGSGLERLRAAGMTCDCGLMAEDSERLNLGFVKRMRTGRPFVRSKVAMSLDGRTAMASGESQWITGPESRLDGHRLRARSCAIVTGRGTLLADDPKLTARLPESFGPVRQPDRFVLDSQNRCERSGRFFEAPGSARILTLSDLPGSAGRVNLDALVEWLGLQGYNEVLFECGPTLNGSLLASGLVDEWVVYLAPLVLGHKARGAFYLPDLQDLAAAHRLEYCEMNRLGMDIRLTLKPLAGSDQIQKTA